MDEHASPATVVEEESGNRLEILPEGTAPSLERCHVCEGEVLAKLHLAGGMQFPGGQRVTHKVMFSSAPWPVRRADFMVVKDRRDAGGLGIMTWPVNYETFATSDRKIVRVVIEMVVDRANVDALMEMVQRSGDRPWEGYARTKSGWAKYPKTECYLYPASRSRRPGACVVS